jgi:hypothetical protein
MREFDGDITKLATHRKTRLASGGTFTVKSGMDGLRPMFENGESVLPKSTVEKLKPLLTRVVPEPGAKELRVEVNVKDLITPILKRMIGQALLDLGFFPFMLDEQPQRLVVIESPFGHPTKVGMEENAAYARRCMLDSLKRGEAPYASHLLYTQCLDDLKTAERKQGMEAGFAWGRIAQHVAVYTDRGVSRGMLEGIKRHQAAGKTIEFRSIDQ